MATIEIIQSMMNNGLSCIDSWTWFIISNASYLTCNTERLLASNSRQIIIITRRKQKARMQLFMCS